jgi:hypothetical protein
MRKKCNRTNIGLPRVPIKEKEEIISKWKENKKSTVLERNQRRKIKENNKTLKKDKDNLFYVTTKFKVNVLLTQVEGHRFKSHVLWRLTPCKMVNSCWRFGTPCCLHLQCPCCPQDAQIYVFITRHSII